MGYHQEGGRYANKGRNGYSQGRRYGKDTRSHGGRNHRSGGYHNKGGNFNKTALVQPDWSRVPLAPFQKNFYTENPAVKDRSEEEILKFRTENEMMVLGEDIPKPIKFFSEANFPNYLLKELVASGFKSPTSIQAQAWPIAMAGRDVIAVAKTGSGKTLGFIMPAIVHINAQPLLKQGEGPIVLVIAPTRELACQIQKESNKYATSSRIKNQCVYGGAPKREQAYGLRNGVEMVICTPGRMIDFLETGTTNFRRVTFLVMDEADRMLDMGFEPQIRKMVNQIRPDRQTLLFSATWPDNVKALASEFLTNPLQINIGSTKLTANKDITQVVKVIDQWDKDHNLDVVLEQFGEHVKSIIFTQTKRKADDVEWHLSNQGYKAAAIHGNKDQWQRDQILADFKSGKIMQLVATDVASRGIHVADLALVINYDFPMQTEDYIHRIGRTGRAGRKGDSVTFFTKKDGKKAHALVEILKDAGQHVPHELLAMGGRGGHSRGMHNTQKKRFGGKFQKNHHRGFHNPGGGKHSKTPAYSNTASNYNNQANSYVDQKDKAMAPSLNHASAAASTGQQAYMDFSAPSEKKSQRYNPY